eukprot:scaffold158_cov228-Pinguiococcus_pyrenoidosus.AAC.2
MRCRNKAAPSVPELVLRSAPEVQGPTRSNDNKKSSGSFPLSRPFYLRSFSLYFATRDTASPLENLESDLPTKHVTIAK